MRHFILTVFIILGMGCLVSTWLLSISIYITAPLASTIFLIGYFSWQSVRSYQLDQIFLSLIRQMGGRVTLEQLAVKSNRSPSQVQAYLNLKVRRGQAVISRIENEQEPTYIFEGFINSANKSFFGPGL